MGGAGCTYRENYKGTLKNGNDDVDFAMIIKYEGCRVLGSSFDKYGLSAVTGYTQGGRLFLEKSYTTGNKVYLALQISNSSITGLWFSDSASGSIDMKAT